MWMGVILRRGEMPITVGAATGFLWQETSFQHVLRAIQATEVWGEENRIFTCPIVPPSFILHKGKHKHPENTKG